MVGLSLRAGAAISRWHRKGSVGVPALPFGLWAAFRWPDLHTLQIIPAIFG